MLDKLTDRDLLLFNPNYKSLFDRLKQKANKESKIGKILKETSSLPAKKKQMALFYFVRQQKERSDSQ